MTIVRSKIEDLTSTGAALIGKNIRVFDQLESTNSLLKAEAELGRIQDGAVVIAEHQVQGRGRYQREWEAPHGKALLMSILLQPSISADRQQLIGLMISLGVYHALIEYEVKFHPGISRIRDNLHLKWPNDLLIGRHKVCGILCESGVDPMGSSFVIVGIGLNVNQTDLDFSSSLRGRATSFANQIGAKINRVALLEILLYIIELLYMRILKDGVDWIVPAWTNQAQIIGKSLTRNENGIEIRGQCVGLNPDGSLLLRDENGQIRTFYSGDIT